MKIIKFTCEYISVFKEKLQSLLSAHFGKIFLSHQIVIDGNNLNLFTGYILYFFGVTFCKIFHLNPNFYPVSNSRKITVQEKKIKKKKRRLIVWA